MLPHMTLFPSYHDIFPITLFYDTTTIMLHHIIISNVISTVTLCEDVISVCYVMMPFPLHHIVVSITLCGNFHLLYNFYYNFNYVTNILILGFYNILWQIIYT